jgi:Family of unknown function (DUF6516)
MSAPEHGLEFLLGFDGRRHWYEGGYYAQFQVRRVQPTRDRPHGVRYSLTLHAPDGKRLVGFDNAHAPPARGSRFTRRPAAVDHWHKTGSDPGRPYAFKDAATLIDDFFDAVQRALTDHGVPFRVVDVDDRRRGR